MDFNSALWAALRELLDEEPAKDFDGEERCPYCDALWRNDWQRGHHIIHRDGCSWALLKDAADEEARRNG